VEAKELTIEHCSTEEMLTDFFTKPLPEKSFFYFRDNVLGIGPDGRHRSSRRSALSNK
jgi:hypothetical protein